MGSRLPRGLSRVSLRPARSAAVGAGAVRAPPTSTALHPPGAAEEARGGQGCQPGRARVPRAQRVAGRASKAYDGLTGLTLDT